MPNLTPHLKLKKPLETENYDINIQNENMDILDKSVSQMKTDLENIDLTASKVTLVDENNYFNSPNVEGALAELGAGQRYKITSNDGYNIKKENVDFNTLTKAGKFVCKGTNAPSDEDWYYLDVDSSDGGWCYQTAKLLYDIRKYERIKANNSTWSPWRRL